MEARLHLRDSTITAAPEPESTPLLAAAVRGRNCDAFNLPVGGLLSINGEIITLTAAAAFKPVCTPVSPPAIIANGGGGSLTIDENAASNSMPGDDGVPVLSNFRDPFYASTFPQCYALAATTVVAYTLVIMLFVTPRSFLDGGVVVLGRRGFTNSGTGPNIGGRPWLQKVAALTVAISLTIASNATFQVAEEQYSYGIQNAGQLQEEVLNGNELKIIRIISQTFLWLAQAQTLIRLFPRQREKVIIKWTAFALITLDVIFQSLNSFQYPTPAATRPGTFQDAVPALSYLFTLALGVLYAAWVIYYSLMKKRYAFYHPQMRNMCLIAVLSLLSILIPVVFFILDISKRDFTGWGEYVRWVGAAAASVIVWEWVERIEALEREEKRDGILGREVFDGDEMIEITPADSRLRRRKKGSDDGDKETSVDSRRDDNPPTGRGRKWPKVTSIAARYRSRSRPNKTEKRSEPSSTQPSNHDRIRFLQPPLWPARPAPAVTPVSRTDTASAASTVYAIRYHPLTETTSRITPPPAREGTAALPSRSGSVASSSRSSDDGSANGTPEPARQADRASKSLRQAESPPSPSRWRALTQSIPLARVRRNGNDEEKAVPSERKPEPPDSSKTLEDDNKWDIRGRLEEFAVTQAERLRERFRPAPDTDSLPVTVIPAPPRRGAALAQLLEEEGELDTDSGETGANRRGGHDQPSHHYQSAMARRNSSASRTLQPGVDISPATASLSSQLSRGSSLGRAQPAPAVAPASASGSGRLRSMSANQAGSVSVLSVAPPTTASARLHSPEAQEGGDGRNSNAEPLSEVALGKLPSSQRSTTGATGPASAPGPTSDPDGAPQ